MINFTNDYKNTEPSAIASGYIGTQKLYRITKTKDGRFLAEKKRKNGQWFEIANCATPDECKAECIKYAIEKAVAPERKRAEQRATKYDHRGRALFDVGARQNWLA